MGASVKAGPEDAVRLARQHFLAGERIDMQSLAAELEIGRTTLYRWVGDRDSLVSDMLSRMVKEALRDTISQASGKGLARVIDGSRRFMVTSSTFKPLRNLIQNETELGLRVMLAPGSAVSTAITEEIQNEITRVRPDWPAGKAAELADVMTQIGMAYEWGNIAVRSEPEIDRAIRAMETLIRAADSTA